MESKDPPSLSPVPRKKALTINEGALRMQHFAGHCHEELGLPLLEKMNTNDLQVAGACFTGEYLALPDDQWAFPAGEEGIHNMRQLVIHALYFLKGEQDPSMSDANAFTECAMYGYRRHLSSTQDKQSIEPFIGKVADAFSHRVQNPENEEFRTEYFRAISSFGTAIAPYIASITSQEFLTFHREIEKRMEMIDNIAINKCGSKLDPITKSRIEIAMLVGLENMRQNRSRPAYQDSLIANIQQTIRNNIRP